MGYPKYRIKSTLDDDYNYVHQPQIKEYPLTGWYNIIASVDSKINSIETADDISNTYVGRSRFESARFTKEFSAKMVIKYHHQELERLKKLAKDNKGKKKIIYTEINPNKL